MAGVAMATALVTSCWTPANTWAASRLVACGGKSDQSSTVEY